jgi:hypothetical protein
MVRRMHLDVIFRSCSGVITVHGGSSRPFDVDKPLLLNTCLHSLIHSFGHALSLRPELDIFFTVIDDHSDETTLSFMRKTLGAAKFRTRILALEGSGNSASLKAAFQTARAESCDLIYFVEDDYLHCPTAIHEMLEVVAQDRVIHPCDYPDRYKAPYESHIVLGSSRYWRTIRHTTGTFLITKLLLEKYWERYWRFTDFDVRLNVTEDTTINTIYREVPCFSPMPSLALHVQHGTISPFVDLKNWWDAATNEMAGSHANQPRE